MSRSAQTSSVWIIPWSAFTTWISSQQKRKEQVITISDRNQQRAFNSRTKRVWKPNIQTVSLYSETLDRKIKLDVTTTALR